MFWFHSGNIGAANSVNDYIIILWYNVQTIMKSMDFNHELQYNNDNNW